MKKDEIVASGVIVAFFIFMLINSVGLHEIRRFGEMGSGFWPMLVLSAATLLSLFLLISNLRKYRKDKEKAPSVAAVSPEARMDVRNRRKKFALSVIFLLIYIVIMPWVGFGLSTLVYVLAFILVLGERRKFVMIFSPILVTVLMILVFSRFIAIPFPKGVGIFAAFSRLIY